jgi:NAD-dependent histone deacetylase SIR2
MRIRYLQQLRSAATSVTRRYPFYRHILRFLALNTGRKHKAHRQQAEQDRLWRNTEKGRRGKEKGEQGTMGQDESRVVDPSVPPTTLKARTLEALAEYIKDGRAQKIVVMVGAVTSLSYVRVLIEGRQVPA